MSTTEQKALYADRNPRKLEPHYTAHVIAMTREDLHSKSDIAAELAWRDQEIEALRAQVEALTKDLADANDSAAWHKRRTSLLQILQSTMQEPERTIVCDVLANGHLLQGPDGLPDKQRYATPAPLTRPAVPEGWKHDCAALLSNDVELWIDACPHCGKPRPALAAAPQPEAQPTEAAQKGRV